MHLCTESAAILAVSLMATSVSAVPTPDRKADYVVRVTRGEGFMPWQTPGVSPEEVRFRQEVEARKDRMLAARLPLRHPVLFTEAELAQARQNMESADWARAWFQRHRDLAQYCIAQPPEWVEQMIPALTPTAPYGFTCPRCVGTKSQEGAGNFRWNYREPEVLRCAACGQVYPSADYPETATLVCPRSGQTFMFYLNDEERRHPEDRSGRYAWRWAGRPKHISFSGMIRQEKVFFMIGAARSLAIAYRFTGESRYAERTVEILRRLATCYRHWLYHDYWDAIADCDPMYAAYHDRALPLEWKRHLCTSAYDKDSAEQAAMLQNFWGAGRLHPSCDSMHALISVCEAYDLTYDATAWTPEARTLVERDLIMEWLMGGEPFLGGPGKAENVNNKAGRVYYPMAVVARCLGIPEWADVALRGFEAQSARSLTYDGFSHESPAYTFSSASYIGGLLGIAETLHGFRWPPEFAARTGVVDLYRPGSRFHLLLRALVDHLLPDGTLPPLADTPVGMRPTPEMVEIGFRRWPEVFRTLFRIQCRTAKPSEYALFHFSADQVQPAAEEEALDLPEIAFPAWMTALLRHGKGRAAATLALTFSPPGGHRHADNLALFYADRGHTILGDHGYIGDTPMNAWIGSTFSHNLVVVDDQEQLPARRQPSRHPRLHLMVTSPRISVVEASSVAYPQCSEYRRLVALIKGPDGGSLVVDFFRVAGGKKHAYRLFSELGASDAPDGALRFEGVAMPPEPPLPKLGGSTRHEDIFGLRDTRTATNPPATWQAVWAQKDRAYRLWMLTPVHIVAASNGPGQQNRQQMGRRVRYVEAIRQGEELRSTFLALHEPSEPGGGWVVRQAEPLVPPPEAGPWAAAVKLETIWGQYWVLSDFAREAEVDGIRFQGQLGVLGRTPQGQRWLLAAGSETLKQGELGFTHQPATWAGPVESNTETTLTPATARPDGFPNLPTQCQVYVLADDGEHWTGFPVETVGERQISVRRFPLPAVKAFTLPAAHYQSHP